MQNRLAVGDLIYLRHCTCGDRGLPSKLHYGRVGAADVEKGVIIKWLDAPYTAATSHTGWDVAAAFVKTTEEELALMLLADEKGDTWPS